MTWLVGAFVVFLCACRVVGHYRDIVVARAERRASCSHKDWKHVNAFGDPRFPVRICQGCGLQEHLKEPIPCPHCGENINQGVRFEA